MVGRLVKGKALLVAIDGIPASLPGLVVKVDTNRSRKYSVRVVVLGTVVHYSTC